MSEQNYLLSTTTETLFFSETAAYDFIDKNRKEKVIENSSVKYKKPTTKASECWIVTLKERVEDVKTLIGAETHAEEDA